MPPAVHLRLHPANVLDEVVSQFCLDPLGRDRCRLLQRYQSTALLEADFLHTHLPPFDLP